MVDTWRYWRIYATDTVSDSLFDWKEVQMMVSSVDQTGSGTASASSSFDSMALPAAYAFDDNDGTRWASQSPHGNEWLRYDFGEGNDVALDEITIKPFAASRAPSDFLVQCSSNGVSWTTAHTVAGLNTGWNSTVARSFTFTSPEVPDETSTNRRIVATMFG